MIFDRKGDGGKGETSYRLRDLERYVEYLIDACCGIEVLRPDWPTLTERKFLVATVILLGEGVTNPINNLALQIYKKYFNYQVDRKVINKYLTALMKKGWLTYDKHDKNVQVLLLLRNINKEKDSVEFKIKIELDATHRRDNDGDSG